MLRAQARVEEQRQKVVEIFRRQAAVHDAAVGRDAAARERRTASLAGPIEA